MLQLHLFFLRNEIPVFIFHSVKPPIFEEQLQFLADNGYRPANSDELYEMIIGKTSVHEKTVLLTIDDGKNSLWVYAYPLLKKHGLKATVFLIPDICKNLMNLFSIGKLLAGQVQAYRSSKSGYQFLSSLTWEESRYMH